MLNQLLSGAIILGSWSIALFFLRYWKRTRDPLFASFAAAFVLFGLERLWTTVNSGMNEFQPYIYMIRLVGFLLIVFGIVNKNRSDNRSR